MLALTLQCNIQTYFNEVSRPFTFSRSITENSVEMHITSSVQSKAFSPFLKDLLERRLPLCLRWRFPPFPSGPHADCSTGLLENRKIHQIQWEVKPDRKKTDEFANQWHRHIYYSIRLIMIPLQVTAVSLYKWKNEMTNKSSILNPIEFRIGELEFW